MSASRLVRNLPPGTWSPSSLVVEQSSGRCWKRNSQGVFVRSTAARSAASQAICGEPALCASSLSMYT
jgi:hypothetical protein